MMHHGRIQEKMEEDLEEEEEEEHDLIDVLSKHIAKKKRVLY